MIIELNKQSYINDIKLLLAQARQKAYTAINHAMVEVYWKIGRRIVEEEQQGAQRATYGEEILQTLSKELMAEFGKGFSYANLRNFRQFYLTYPKEQICYTLCSKLTWSHNRLIMYIRMFDDLKRGHGDNPTIGIILCAEKDETIVKYSILKENQRLFASKYMPYLPTKAELIAEVEREKKLLEEKFGRELV
ncbi:MAG: PDDEXK nuclease domain-containing protein [Bacteroidales bacterium]|jgi:hypothetical protein|nr:PDDEXK nuclease domain-containing protein [Bacteroidales bacterium]